MEGFIVCVSRIMSRPTPWSSICVNKTRSLEECGKPRNAAPSDLFLCSVVSANHSACRSTSKLVATM